MFNARHILLGITLITLLGTSNAHAKIIVYFDDLPRTDEGIWLEDGYQGFNWEGWKYQSEPSGNNYAFSGDGSAVTISRTDGYRFDFDGANFAADSSSTAITVEGWIGNDLISTETYTGFDTAFTFQASSIKEIDRVVFSGTDPWRMDVFVDRIRMPPPPVPEPTTLLAGALLLLPFGASVIKIMRRRRQV